MQTNRGVEINLYTDGKTFSVEGLPFDSSAGELREAFDRLLFQAGFLAEVRCAEGGVISMEYKEEE